MFCLATTTGTIDGHLPLCIAIFARCLTDWRETCNGPMHESALNFPFLLLTSIKNILVAWKGCRFFLSMCQNTSKMKLAIDNQSNKCYMSIKLTHIVSEDLCQKYCLFSLNKFTCYTCSSPVVFCLECSQRKKVMKYDTRAKNRFLSSLFLSAFEGKSVVWLNSFRIACVKAAASETKHTWGSISFID